MRHEWIKIYASTCKGKGPMLSWLIGYAERDKGKKRCSDLDIC